MSREKIKSKVIAMIAENTDIEDIREEFVFNSDIVLDSLSFAEMLMECEEAFGIDIPMEEASGFKTVKDLIDFLDDKASTKSNQDS